MGLKAESYREFWPLYLREHSKPLTRAFHVVGTLSAVAFLIYGGATARWGFVLVAPVVGYALAWFSHFFIERNVPATMSYPGWSLWSDFRMAALCLTGRLGSELERVESRHARPS